MTRRSIQLRRSGKTAVIGSAAALLVFGLGGCGGTTKTSNAPATQRVSVSGPTSGGGASRTAPPEVDKSLRRYGLRVADYPTFDALARAYYEEVVAYRSSGHVSGQPGNPDYLDALYGPDWQSGDMAPFVQFDVDSSVAVINRHIATGANGDPEYEESMTVTHVSEVSEAPDQSEISGVVDLHYSNNAAETVLANLPEADSANSRGRFDLKFSNHGGYWQLTYARNMK